MLGDGVASMNESEDAINLLRFVVLSTSVHADAVQCAVDDFRKVLLQMHNEEELLKILEAEVKTLNDQSKKFHQIHRLLSVSREERVKGEPLRAGQTDKEGIEVNKTHVKKMQHGKLKSYDKQESQPNHTAPSTFERPLCKIGSEVSSATDLANQSNLRLNSSDSIYNTLHTLDFDLHQLKKRIQELDGMSIRSKLLNLESMRQRARKVNTIALLQAHIERFEFPEEVLWLWEGEAGSKFSHSSALPAPRFRSQMASIRKGPERRNISHQNQRAVTNPHNINELIAGACRRLKERYEHAFRMLMNTSSEPNDQATSNDVQGVLKQFLYAQHLEGAGNYNLSALQILQGLENEALTEHYSAKHSQYVASSKIAEGHPGKHQTVLPNLGYCALPLDWAIPQRLASTPLETFLPPAQHILTPRFSFANLEEINRLDRLRLRIQKCFLNSLLENKNLLEGIIHVKDKCLPMGEKEKAIFNARAAIADTVRWDDKPSEWKTAIDIEKKQQN